MCTNLWTGGSRRIGAGTFTPALYLQDPPPSTEADRLISDLAKQARHLESQSSRIDSWVDECGLEDIIGLLKDEPLGYATAHGTSFIRMTAPSIKARLAVRRILSLLRSVSDTDLRGGNSK